MASGHRTRRDARTSRNRARPESRRRSSRRDSDLRRITGPLDLGELDPEVVDKVSPDVTERMAPADLEADDTASGDGDTAVAEAATDADDPESGTRRRRSRTVSRESVQRLALTRWKRINTRRTLVLAVVLTAVAITLAMPMRTYFAQRADFDEQRALNAQLREEVVDYQQRVNEQNDPAYIEAQARERLHYVMPGEKPFVVVFEGREEELAAQEAAEQRARNPWYVNLWDAVATPPGTDE